MGIRRTTDIAMNQRLLRLRSIADSSHADLMHVAQQLREARDECGVIERHRDDLGRKRFKLAAPDAARLEELKERISFLDDKHERLRADHADKRTLLDACEKEIARG